MRILKTIVWTLAVLGLLAFAAHKAYRYKQAALARAADAKRELAERAKRPVPVLTAQAGTRDVPVWLANPGAVQAFNTVTVRPRVGGSLDAVLFTEGQAVKAGDLLARIDPRPYEAALHLALAHLAQDEALHLNATQEVARVRHLLAGGAETQRALDTQTARAAELAAAIMADQAALETARLNLGFTELRAPIAGITGLRRLDAGSLVTADQPEGLVTVTQTHPIYVVFTLPQRHLADILPHIGVPGAPPLPVQALDDRTGRVLAEGTLALLDNQVDRATDAITLKALFPNADNALWPGQYVNARVKASTLAAAVLVPNAAVLPGIDGAFVYTIAPDGTAAPRTVTPGMLLPDENLRVITSGLAAGETVVREGHNKLRPGTPIAPATETDPR
jgi:multidrug efflux system membrane fusion protein